MANEYSRLRVNRPKYQVPRIRHQRPSRTPALSGPAEGQRGRANERAREECEKALGTDGGAKARKRRIQISYESALRRDSPRVVDKLARYEGAYAFIRLVMTE